MSRVFLAPIAIAGIFALPSILSSFDIVIGNLAMLITQFTLFLYAMWVVFDEL